MDTVSGIRIIRFDTFDLLKNVATNPAAYGFVNGSDPCYSGFVFPDPGATACTNPEGYVFWDVEHPTTAFHELLAKELFLAAVPEPPTFALYVFGFAIAIGVRVRSGLRTRPRS